MELDFHPLAAKKMLLGWTQSNPEQLFLFGMEMDPCFILDTSVLALGPFQWGPRFGSPPPDTTISSGLLLLEQRVVLR